MRTLMICMLCAVTAYAQYNDSPAPPRLQIPGAIPLGGPIRPGGYRQGRLHSAPVPGNAPIPRIRRPGLGRPSFKSVEATPRPSLQSLEEPAKPVTEEPEDEIEVNTPTAFSPNFISTPEPQNDYYDITTTSQPKPPIVFNPTPFQQSTPSALKPEPIPVRPTQYRPLLNPQSFNPNRNEQSFNSNRNEPSFNPNRNEPSFNPNRNEPSFNPNRNEPSFNPNRNEPSFNPNRNEPSKPQRLQPLSSRPARPVFRPETRPLLEENDAPIQPVRQYTRPQEPARAPVKSAPQKYTPSHNREKKPVAQIIRKYREENEDGSITWGFENDDGSFKEETIGVDCVTRGRYGYVDPDGLKREYNYETGILCDKNKEQQEEKGFIDYQENKAVLPNGITIDLAAMGKKSRRPFRSPNPH